MRFRWFVMELYHSLVFHALRWHAFVGEVRLGPRTTVGLDGVWEFTCIRLLRMPSSCSLSVPTCVFVGLSWNYTIRWFSMHSDGMHLWERCVFGPRTTVGLDGVWDYTCIRWLRMRSSCSLSVLGGNFLRVCPL